MQIKGKYDDIIPFSCCLSFRCFLFTLNMLVRYLADALIKSYLQTVQSTKVDTAITYHSHCGYFFNKPDISKISASKKGQMGALVPERQVQQSNTRHVKGRTCNTIQRIYPNLNFCHHHFLVHTDNKYRLITSAYDLHNLAPDGQCSTAKGYINIFIFYNLCFPHLLKLLKSSVT